MTSRMDRYDTKTNEENSRRLSKNKELYEKLYTNSSYTEFAEITSSNVIDLTDNSTKISRREDYHRKKDYFDTLGEEEISQKYNNYAYNQIIDSTPRDYDINSVLEKAKKNRGEIDDLEKKRKLRTTEYNILTDLTQEKLKEHKERKKEVLSKEEEQELTELIHTITSNTMRQEIDDELLSGLMPSNLDETIVSQDLSEEIKLVEENKTLEEKKSDEEPEDDIYATISKLDSSFYTKSMDLSDQDLIPAEESEDEIDTSFADFDSRKGLVIRIIAAIIVLILIAIICIIIYNVIVGGK